MNAHAHNLTRSQVVALLEERDTLREQIRQLEEALRPTIILPRAWRLTRRESDFLNVLRAAAPNVVHRERMLIALYGTWDDAPEQKITDVYLCKVRRKLMEAQARIEIETVWGRGWRLSPESVVRFDEAVADYRDSFGLALDRRAA
ncbi:helix-turn-helix domain-containing protein [Methylorubrum populi]|uniref:OmpR/PhoB-type domain-containing protein n=1 Tax=Methylorubrum populi TaxID=223967 RepID=A0A833J0Q7_9HYPH|nr:helix-turn-helix domain-containing protein [Methylorubrum populi]KAB7782408.1 hypothetical protein F8B43_5163 [Methylorubrum populi]